MVGLYTKLFTVYESPLVFINRRVSAYTSLRLYECPLHPYPRFKLMCFVYISLFRKSYKLHELLSVIQAAIICLHMILLSYQYSVIKQSYLAYFSVAGQFLIFYPSKIRPAQTYHVTIQLFNFAVKTKNISLISKPSHPLVWYS